MFATRVLPHIICALNRVLKSKRDYLEIVSKTVAKKYQSTIFFFHSKCTVGSYFWTAISESNKVCDNQTLLACKVEIILNCLIRSRKKLCSIWQLFCKATFERKIKGVLRRINGVGECQSFVNGLIYLTR